jgi:hypothetical protein
MADRDGKIERPFAKLYREIWRDGAFVDLDEGPQLLFLKLLSQTNLTAAGTLPLQPVRWANMTADNTAAIVRERVLSLHADRFVVADWDTEELLIRTAIRNDRVWNRSPKSQIGILRCALKVDSSHIRAVLADEIEACLDMFVVSTDRNGREFNVFREACDAVEALRGGASSGACIEACTDAYIEPVRSVFG